MKRRLLAVLLLVTVCALLGARWLAAAEPALGNVDFVEADLRDVFRSLGIAGEYNVLLTKEVQGTVTITLRQGMTVRDAIALIARTYDFDLRWLDDRTVVVGRAATLKQNFDTNVKVTKVFTLFYSNVQEILDVLKVVGESKQMAANPRTNQITVVGSPLEIANAEEIIAEMDHPMPQVNIEARMEEVVEDSMRELGLKWSGTLEFGYAGSVVSYPEITATLNILETANKAVLLAQPNTSSLDSQEATIFIGDRYPVTTANVVDGKTTYTTSYVEIGTKLTVKPRVNMENIVTVSVKADVSSITGTVVTVAGSEVPIIRTRTTEAMARLRDGQTFVLTGLIRRDDTTGTTGVPLLDKVPILSILFKNKKTESKNTVICVFLTPRISKVVEEEVPAGRRPPAGGMAPASTPGSTVSASPTPGPATPSPATPALEVATPAPLTTPPPEEVDISAEELAAVAGEAGAAQPLSGPLSTAASPEEFARPTAAATPDPGRGMEPLPAVVTPAPLPVFTQAPGATPSPTEGPVFVPAAPAIATPSVAPYLPRPEEIKDLAYQVKKGDTLASIGKKFGVPWTKIAAYNKLNTKATIRPGQRLLVPIPDNHKYIVRPKETLWRIAKRYGVPVELLTEINNLDDPTRLEVGQVIVLPCSVDRVVNRGY